MNVKDIKEIIEMVGRMGISHFELENEGVRLIIKNNDSEDIVTPCSKKKSLDMEKVQEKKIPDELFIVKSPMVGTYYSSPSPDSPEFAKVGSKVKVGDTLCIIEAMKAMNEIVSENEGEIFEVYAANGDVVEYGQPLMSIKK